MTCEDCYYWFWFKTEDRKVEKKVIDWGKCKYLTDVQPVLPNTFPGCRTFLAKEE